MSILNNANNVKVGTTPASKVYLGSSLVYAKEWSPTDIGESLALWLDVSDTDTITLNGSNISQWQDKSGNSYHASQAIAANQPTYPAEQNRVIFNATDRLFTTLPAITGTLILGTTNGTAAYGVNIPSGSYDIGRRGGNYMPDNAAYGYILSNTTMNQANIDEAIAYLRDKGAGQNYGNVSDFTNYWREWSELTSFPLINTGSGTNFSFAWYSCTSLTSFPFINTSAGTNFQEAWRFCSNLTSFPANFFDNCLATNFNRAFGSTNLSQQSIDSILVSIESNGTSNGVFGQSGGSAPSTVGQNAITAMRNRGWTVTVTGGF